MTGPLTLIVLIDALGLRQALTPGFLPWCTAPRRPVRSVLGYSSAAIPTLLSGRSPDEHGHFSMYRRAAGGTGVFRGLCAPAAWFARVTGRSWRARSWLAGALRSRGVTGYFSLYDVPLDWLGEFDLCQRRNLFAPGAFEGSPGLADDIVAVGGRLWNWGVPEARAFEECAEAISSGSEPVLFLYTARLDALMHAEGPDSPAVSDLLLDYSVRLTEMRDRAAERGRTLRLFVFGDHGMARVDRTIDLWTRLRRLRLVARRDYLYFLDSTMARFWFSDSHARELVQGTLREVPEGRLLSEEELRDLGCWFPASDYGESIFLLEEGVILVPSFMGATPVRGMHGYHPGASASSTSLVTNVDGVESPSDLRELHALLRKEIGP